MGAIRIFRRLRDLLDVDAASLADGDVPTYRILSDEFEMEQPPGGGGGPPTGPAGGVLSGTYPNPGFAEELATEAEFEDHSARHENGGADEISIAGLDGTPTELTNHLNDTSDAHDASAISFTPAGTIAATDVQAAIEEVATEAGGSVNVEDESLIVAMEVFA